MSSVQSWENKAIAGHEFRGILSNRDLSFHPAQAVAAVKAQLIEQIVGRIMEKLGPSIDEAIESAFARHNKDTIDRSAP